MSAKAKEGIKDNHIIFGSLLTSLIFPLPLTGSILLILAYLLFFSVFFSFLLLISLIIFSKKTNDPGKGAMV